MRYRPDPGPCITCGAEHSACTASSGPIAIPQLPARDALMATAQLRELPADLALPVQADPEPVLVADRIQADLPPGSFTTGTYRGTKKRR